MKCAKYGTWMKAKMISMVRKKEKHKQGAMEKGSMVSKPKQKAKSKQWESIQLCFKVLCPFIDH